MNKDEEGGGANIQIDDPLDRSSKSDLMIGQS